MEDQFTVNLEGGRPWGFALQGGTDFRSPLRIGRVTPGGRASQAGVVGGNYILMINDTPCEGLKHLQAQQLVVKATQQLNLVCTKTRPSLASPSKPGQSFTFPAPPPVSNGYQYKPPTPSSSQPLTPRTPITPSEPIAKPRPPSMTWSTPCKSTPAGGGVANGEGGGANVQVCDAILQDIQSFTVDLAQSTADGDSAQQDINGTPNMDEWEIINAPPAEEFQSFQQEEGRAEEQVATQPPSDQQQEQPAPEPARRTAKSPSPDPAIKVAMTTKSTGWYQQMFKDLQKASPSTTVGEKRGDVVDKPRGRQRTPSDSEESTSYDHRGLRVRSSSFSKVESTSVEVKSEPRARPKTKLPVDPTMTAEDVIHALKRSTSFKSNRRAVNERAGKSRNYWKKVEETAVQEKERKRSTESRPRSYSELPRRSPDYHSTKMMHPLLRDAEEPEPAPQPSSSQPSSNQAPSDEPTTTTEPPPGPQDVFSRIDASKLHGAVENAVVMGTLEKEGVPTTALPLSPPSQEKAKVKSERRKSKELKPPPAEKARARYNFDAQTGKELSFKKGDIIELTHSVDENWLEGGVDGRKGIFPKAYVMILTEEQILELMAPKVEKPLEQVKALYDFGAQTGRELSFEKGDILSISRKIDANWYEGFLGDKKGIFPVAYVEVIEASQ